MKKEADLYKKVVYWSKEDNCFVGMCPELIYGGVHGDDALKVFVELNQAVDEAIQIMIEAGKPLPMPRELAFETA
jgi:predicted RNase H-like HicB family nuclease